MTDIQYQILEIQKNQAAISAVVRYWTAAWPEGLIYTVDIPVDLTTGTLGTPEELKQKILHFAPTGQLEQIAKMQAFQRNIDLSDFEALITPTTPPDQLTDTHTDT